MARARTIKPAFFKNEELAECPYEARLLFIGLWTLADADGRLEYRPKRIKAELFPFDEIVTFHDLVVTLHGKKLLCLYESDGQQYIQICTFKKHQRPHPHEPSMGFPQPPEIPETYVKAVTSNGEQLQNLTKCAVSLLPSTVSLQSFNPSTSSGELAKPDSPPSEFEFPTAGKIQAWTLPQSKLEEYVEAYPGLDVPTQIRKARQWCRDKTRQRKTPGGMPSFLTNWLNKANDSYRGNTTQQQSLAEISRGLPRV